MKEQRGAWPAYVQDGDGDGHGALPRPEHHGARGGDEVLTGLREGPFHLGQVAEGPADHLVGDVHRPCTESVKRVM